MTAWHWLTASTDNDGGFDAVFSDIRKASRPPDMEAGAALQRLLDDCGCNFRAEPADAQGKPMQQSIVEAALAGEHVLGILPTGTGKSLCYQIPALSRYDKTGALTVVISPLVALMADQVVGLEKHGISCSVAVNGLLSLPERSDALTKVRLGEAGILSTIWRNWVLPVTTPR